MKVNELIKLLENCEPDVPVEVCVECQEQIGDVTWGMTLFFVPVQHIRVAESVELYVGEAQYEEREYTRPKTAKQLYRENQEYREYIDRLRKAMK